MKYFMAIIVCVFSIVFMYSMVHGEQQIDQCCKNECMEKGGGTDNCDSVCSLTDNSGKVIKNSDCISFCLNTRYLCYLSCGNDKIGPEKLAFAKGN